ncbi:HNH endonuclease signature motif containing protein [Mycolicibacterium arenosum]|uniref:HNH endonuclease n=1 Tax=Mycolicibacterium arenosum TaxID=2952157 RepID=A0ABT1M7N7_9MYCO|nr:HNH endonuclease signature motif containing protein [Mycolicibacterium sp. CAU 1645]MCP9275166.1 HNH endonuclease [Mycolicibacterium sp. CAU 1645]
MIRKFFTALPAQVDSITKAQGEKSLAEAATQLDSRGLTVVAMQLLALRHPDGDESADAAAKKAGLTLGPQQPDGLSYLRGWADPPPPQAGPVLDGQWRTKSQYAHDAFETALDLLLRCNTLGTLNGLPTTVVVTTTLQELQAGAGYAVTGGGSRLPMRDLIAMAADAHHYLAVFDGHTGQALHLGRSQRCATGAQKLMLFARERGCTCPGCTVDWYRTQAHHAVLDWKRDGQTNIDDLTLACGAGNQMIENTGWTTRRRPDGRFEWVDPGTGRAHLNDLHHPERLLTPKDDDPF